MIDVYYWPTPNCRKITIFLEEAALPYTVIPVDIGAGDQYAAELLAISPNGLVPAIRDRDTGITVFESAAILWYLAEVSGRFVPADLAGRTSVHEWLVWQVSGLGPALGQAGHFRTYAAEKQPYPIARYEGEVKRLFGVLDRRLDGRDYVAGDYSIADMACFPWVWSAPRITGEDFAEFPHLSAWRTRVAAREAVKRGMVVGKELKRAFSDDDKRVLFRGRGV
jgi:GST-like protein